ncbi:MAG: type II secretion system protein GspE, partial [Candidatus Omnitrophota bacterium]|nr:type II secretion system protein GspE [Candidatus Omnitrophota bacterium]
FMLNSDLKEMILNEVPNPELLQKAKECGLRTLKEDGLEKVKMGHTTIQEVLRVTQDI